MSPPDLQVHSFPDPDEFHRWLTANTDSPGIWLRMARKASGEPSVTHQEAVQVALRHGWIDGQGKSDDDRHWLVRFTPRRPTSRWSLINRDRAEQLIDDGLMTPAGLAEVQRAKSDGRWDAAYAGMATATVPPDLQAALDQNPEAAAAFAGLDSANRYAILYRVHDVRRADTRSRRVATYVTMLAAGQTLHPPRSGPH